MFCRIAMKALGVAAAAGIAFAPFLVLAPVAHAYPCTAQMTPQLSGACINGPAPAALPRQTQASPPPTAVPVQTPKINPKAPGAPRNASVVTPPKGLDAPPQAVRAAKSAPAARINPANPPKPPQVDFNEQVQNVSSGNVEVLVADNQALIRPRRWDYVDYDIYHRPTLYNPLKEAMTFRYVYDGVPREVYIPSGGRIVLDVATAGLFPFTAVSDSYVASGSFYGGAWIPPDGWDGPPPPDYTPPAPPEVYQGVLVYVRADDQTVEVSRLEIVGHDGSQPVGNQDTFLLDDTTLAWGQINDPSSSAQIRVTKSQSMPGVGSTDHGSFLVALAAHEQPPQPLWPWALGGGVVMVVGLGALDFSYRRNQRGSDVLAAGASEDAAVDTIETARPQSSGRFAVEMSDKADLMTTTPGDTQAKCFKPMVISSSST
jgi:hypothetical protein